MRRRCFQLSFWDPATLDRTISLVQLSLVGLDDDLPQFYINLPPSPRHNSSHFLDQKARLSSQDQYSSPWWPPEQLPLIPHQVEMFWK